MNRILPALPRGGRPGGDVRLEGGLVVGAQEEAPLGLQRRPEAETRRRGRKSNLMIHSNMNLNSSASNYRAPKNGLYEVARNLILLLLTCTAWPCLGPA